MKIAPLVFFAPFAVTHTLPFALAAFAEQITNQLAVWALVTGVVGFLLALALRSRQDQLPAPLAVGDRAAVASVGMGYLALIVVDALFKVDFRFWVLGLKPLDGRHFGFFLVYLPFFTVFFLLSLKGFCASLPVKGEGERPALVFGGLAMALGFAIMLAAQYVAMATTGLLLTPGEPLNTIIAFQFVPLLFVIGVICRLHLSADGRLRAGRLRLRPLHHLVHRRRHGDLPGHGQRFRPAAPRRAAGGARRIQRIRRRAGQSAGFQPLNAGRLSPKRTQERSSPVCEWCVGGKASGASRLQVVTSI